MKITPTFLCLAVAALTCLLPSARVNSQLAPSPADPMTALQALQTANDDLIKRQETTLKDLTDLTTEAREVRIFSRRG